MTELVKHGLSKMWNLPKGISSNAVKLICIHIILALFVSLPLFAHNNVSALASMRGALTFTLESAQIIMVGSDNYLSLDVMVSSPDANQRIGTGIVQLNYNPAVFGENVKGNNNAIVSLGSLITMSPFPFYNLIVNDNAPSRLAVTFEYMMPAGYGGLLTTAPQQLLNVKLKVLTTGAYCGISFQQNLMVNQQYMDNNFTLFNPIEASDIENSLIPSQPIDLNLTINDNNLSLMWQQVTDCTYTVYSVEDPDAGDWQVEASGLAEPVWNSLVQESGRFFRVTATGIPGAD